MFGGHKVGKLDYNFGLGRIQGTCFMTCHVFTICLSNSSNGTSEMSTTQVVIKMQFAVSANRQCCATTRLPLSFYRASQVQSQAAKSWAKQAEPMSSKCKDIKVVHYLIETLGRMLFGCASLKLARSNGQYTIVQSQNIEALVISKPAETAWRLLVSLSRLTKRREKG